MRLVPKIAAFSLAVLALCASEAQALPSVTMRIDGPVNDQDPPYYADFAPNQQALDTFTNTMVTLNDQAVYCVERNEVFNNGSSYTFTIDPFVSLEGGSGAESLSAESAYLFDTFARGLWASRSLTFSTSSDAQTEGLQQAFWILQGDQTLAGVLSAYGGNTSLAAQAQTWASTYISAATNAVLSGAWSGIGAVRVMNLWSGTAYTEAADKQSQLVLTLPIPSSAWLGLGMMSVLGVVGAIRRRKRQALV